MKRNIYALLLALIAVIATTNVNAQTNRANNSSAPKAPTSSIVSAPSSNPLMVLPASDVVASVNTQRLLTEALPKALAGDQARLARIMSEIDRFHQRTGIDARSLQHVAVGIRFRAVPGRLPKTSTVAVASGKFNASTLVAMGRLAAKGKYQEQPYGGKTIYTFALNEQIKLLGLLPVRISDIAIAALDAGTFAVGSPESVRAAIDATAGRGRVDPQLAAMAMRNPNSLVSAFGNVPASAVQGLDVGNEEITNAVASIRQFYMSLGTTSNGFDMQLAAMTSSNAQARKLNDTLSAMKQLAPLLISQAPSDLGGMLRNVVNSLTITTQGSEVQLKTELKQPDIATLLRMISPPPPSNARPTAPGVRGSR